MIVRPNMKLLHIAVLVIILSFTEACLNSRQSSGSSSGDGGTRGSSGSNPCDKVNIITRGEWGAMALKDTTHMTTPVSKVFIHHTTGSGCTTTSLCKERVRGFQRFHMDDRGWSDIGYSWLVGEDGNVYEGRGWDRVGAHTLGYNSVAVAVSVIGDFTSRLPNAAALQAVKDIIACGIHKNKINSNYDLFGHCQGRRPNQCTECPGDTLYSHIRTWPQWSSSLVDPCEN